MTCVLADKARYKKVNILSNSGHFTPIYLTWEVLPVEVIFEMSDSISFSRIEGVSSVSEKSQSAKFKVKRPETNVADLNIQTMDDLERQLRQGENIPISEQQLIRAIERAIKAMQGANTMLEFSIHEKTKEIMVKVLNRETGEVIREIPPEKILDFLAKLWEMAGLFIDERR